MCVFIRIGFLKAGDYEKDWGDRKLGSANRRNIWFVWSFCIFVFYSWYFLMSPNPYSIFWESSMFVFLLFGFFEVFVSLYEKIQKVKSLLTVWRNGTKYELGDEQPTYLELKKKIKSGRILNKVNEVSIYIK